MELARTRKLAPATLLSYFSVVLIGTMVAIPALAQTSADQMRHELASGNRRFVNGQSDPRNLVRRRKELPRTQSPSVAALSCADSRVPPELVFDEGVGDLFVVRSAGDTGVVTKLH